MMALMVEGEGMGSLDGGLVVTLKVDLVVKELFALRNDLCHILAASNSRALAALHVTR